LRSGDYAAAVRCDLTPAREQDIVRIVPHAFSDSEF
jgi:hypothetical protein